MHEFHAMIVKLGEDPGFEEWASKDTAVKAIKMREDFLVETSLGFLPGKRNDFLVEMTPGVRFPCSEEAFLKGHARLEYDGVDRRKSSNDRRRHDEPAI